MSWPLRSPRLIERSYRPTARLVLDAVMLAVLVAFPGLSTPGVARPEGEVPLYTDEDLKPKRRAPKPEEEVLPGGAGALPAADPRAAGGPQSQPQSRPGPTTRNAPSTRPAPASPVPAPGAPATAAAPQPRDDSWARQWRHDQERQAFWSGRIQVAQQEIARIEERIVYLERKRASIQNPFLPRVPLSEEDRREEEGMDGAALRARVEQQIAQARADLERARQALDKARAQAAEALSPPTPLEQVSPTN